MKDFLYLYWWKKIFLIPFYSLIYILNCSENFNKTIGKTLILEWRDTLSNSIKNIPIKTLKNQLKQTAPNSQSLSKWPVSWQKPTKWPVHPVKTQIRRVRWFFSTIFSATWLWQGAQCSLLQCCLTEVSCPRHLTLSRLQSLSCAIASIPKIHWGVSGWAAGVKNLNNFLWNVFIQNIRMLDCHI